jgi:hypothetical protein
MEMLLMGACLSMFGLAVMCLAFGAATRDEKPLEPAELAKALEPVKAAAPERFFVDAPLVPITVHAKVPIEALLLQLENHVRLEQAAAESYMRAPTAALLHSRTISPLVN